jgi:hypothetical protein
MSDLRRLATGSQALDLGALRHLGSLTRVRKLQCPNSSKDILKSIQESQSAAFPELQQLALHETDLPSFTRLITCLKPLQLQCLTLSTQPIPTADHIRDTFSALEKTIPHTGLNRVVLKLIWNADRGRRPEFREDIVKGFTMEPLLSFHNLTVVELNLPCAFEMGDGQIEAMAEAWPRLRRLQLGTLAGWHIPPSVTIIGVLALIRKCRELEHLVLSFNALSESMPLRSSLTPADVNEKITYLYVGNGRTTLPEAKRMARFLLRIFPRLCGIGGEWLHHRVAGGDHPVSYQREWEMVVGCLKDVKSDAPYGPALDVNRPRLLNSDHQLLSSSSRPAE